jgi:hypothetical protein
MRVFVVELSGPDDSHLRNILQGMARRLAPGETGAVPRGDGTLAPRSSTEATPDPDAGEPQ